METIYFKSDNLTLAASLAIEFPLVGVEMVSSTKAIFCFKHTPKLEKAVSNFWSNKTLVSPLLFQEKVKELKKEIVSKSYSYVEK